VKDFGRGKEKEAEYGHLKDFSIFLEGGQSGPRKETLKPCSRAPLESYRKVTSKLIN
jgi:hypothetical protein